MVGLWAQDVMLFSPRLVFAEMEIVYFDLLRRLVCEMWMLMDPSTSALWAYAQGERLFFGTESLPSERF